MAKLDNYIQELLYNYDCIVIPEFGGFVTNYRPAQIDTDKNLFHPPAKDISFNRSLRKNDGLLANYISDKSKISFEDANGIIREAVESYFTSLNNGESVRFEKIGVLHLDKNKNLNFSPSDEVNYLLGSFGFETFYAPPVEEKDMVSREVVQTPASKTSVNTFAGTETNNRDEKATVTAKAKPAKTRYWIAAAILPIIGISGYISLKTGLENPENINLARILPFTQTEEAKYQSGLHKTLSDSSATEPTLFPDDKDLFQYSFSEGRISEAGLWVNLEENSGKTAPATVNAEVGPYHIIAGCFGDLSNAQKLVAQLQEQGYQAGILDFHKNLHRVKISSYSDFNLALAELEEYKTGILPKAWMLKKAL